MGSEFQPSTKKRKEKKRGKIKRGKKNPRGRRGRNTLGDEEVAYPRVKERPLWAIF